MEELEQFKKAVITTMVGAVADIEKVFGQMALEEKCDPKDLNDALETLRNSIFDRGNAQIRKIGR